MSNNFRQTPNSQQIPAKIVGSSSFGRYHKISSSFTQNLFESDSWLVNFAGYKRKLNFPVSDQGRGIFRSARGNILIAVVGANVYLVDKNFVVTKLGQLVTQSGFVVMDENLNNQICIVDGLNAYIVNYSLPGNLTIQQGGPLGSNLIPNYVQFHDTFFLIGNANKTNNGAQWYAYSYNSPTTIIVTSQLALQTKPDYAVAVLPIPSQANNVLVFGTTVCEIQTQIGGTQNYRRSSTVNIDFGCLSVATIASSDKYIVWLGVNEANSPVIMVYNEQSAIPISTDGIDYVLGRINYPAQSTALFRRIDGHLFYQLTFFNPADNLTLIYDFNTQKFFHLTDQNENFHPALSAVYFNDKTYFMSINTGALYEESTDFFTYDENITPVTSPLYVEGLNYDIPRTRITESIRKADSGRFVANSFVFTMSQGDDPNVTGLSIASAYPYPILTENAFVPSNVNLITEQQNMVILAEQNTGPIVPYSIFPYLPPTKLVYRPRIDMTISKDSGTIFGNTVSRYLNPVGQRQNIITFGNLGRANDLTIKLRIWSRSNVVLSDGVVDIY
ncbi:MAG: stabilization protein [Caudoviricetes sp.]|nr:MAG: stabilization protein [Caudoviricetes sp.]